VSKHATIDIGHTVMWVSDEPDYDHVNDTYDVVRYFGTVRNEWIDPAWLVVKMTGFVELYGTDDAWVNDNLTDDEMRVHYTDLVLYPPDQKKPGRKRKPISPAQLVLPFMEVSHE